MKLPAPCPHGRYPHEPCPDCGRFFPPVAPFCVNLWRRQLRTQFQTRTVFDRLMPPMPPRPLYNRLVMRLETIGDRLAAAWRALQGRD